MIMQRLLMTAPLRAPRSKFHLCAEQQPLEWAGCLAAAGNAPSIHMRIWMHSQAKRKKGAARNTSASAVGKVVADILVPVLPLSITKM